MNCWTLSVRDGKSKVFGSCLWLRFKGCMKKAFYLPSCDQARGQRLSLGFLLRGLVFGFFVMICQKCACYDILCLILFSKDDFAFKK